MGSNLFAWELYLGKSGDSSCHSWLNDVSLEADAKRCPSLSIHLFPGPWLSKLDAREKCTLNSR